MYTSQQQVTLLILPCINQQRISFKYVSSEQLANRNGVSISISKAEPFILKKNMSHIHPCAPFNTKSQENQDSGSVPALWFRCNISSSKVTTRDEDTGGCNYSAQSFLWSQISDSRSFLSRSKSGSLMKTTPAHSLL